MRHVEATSCNAESSWAATAVHGGCAVHTHSLAHTLSHTYTLQSNKFKGGITISGNAFVFKVYIFVDIFEGSSWQCGGARETQLLLLHWRRTQVPRQGGHGGRKVLEPWLRGTESHLLRLRCSPVLGADVDAQAPAAWPGPALSPLPRCSAPSFRRAPELFTKGCSPWNTVCGR